MSNVPEMPSLCLPLLGAREKIEEQIRSGVDLLVQIERFPTAPVIPVDTGQYLRDREELSYRWTSWHKANETLLRRLFSTGEVAAQYFNNTAQPRPDPSAPLTDSYGKRVKLALLELRALRDRLEHYPPAQLVKRGTPGTKGDRPSSRRIFVVHGKDEAMLQSTARLLERLELEPVVLREQPSQGRTIIEKLVDYSDVSYAVVLLAPDDRGGLASDPRSEQRLRARQNVILELGFFLGALGRDNVCSLYAEGVEIPSDYSGVVFVPFDIPGAWKQALVRELRTIWSDVDLNKAP